MTPNITLAADYFEGVEEGAVTVPVLRAHTSPGYVVVMFRGRERVVDADTGRLVNG
jgi:hypothetical protein